LAHKALMMQIEGWRGARPPRGHGTKVQELGLCLHGGAWPRVSSTADSPIMEAF